MSEYSFHEIQLSQVGNPANGDLHRSGFVSEILYADQTGGDITAALHELHEVMKKSVESVEVVSDDSRTFTRTKYGVFHDTRKCNTYAGGVARVLFVGSTR